MVKIRVILLFGFDENKTDYTGEELLDHIREAFKEAAAEEDFWESVELVDIKLIEEEVEPF